MKRSTKTTDRKKAEKMARLFEEESRAKRTAKQARAILAGIYKDLSGEELPAMTVRQFFDTFTRRKKTEVAQATLEYYEGHSRRFLEWLGPAADTDISEISKSKVTAYRDFALSKAGPRTTNNTLKAIKTFFAAARKDGLLSEDPAADVDTVRDRSESARRPFTLEELRTLVAAATPEWRSMVLFGLYTGQWLGDIATLTWQAIDLAKGEVRMTTRKTGRRQELPIAPPLKAHIKGLIRPEDGKLPVHPIAAAIMVRDGRAGKLSDQFARLLIAAGLRNSESGELDTGGKRAKHELSFHSLRHTATSLLKEAGIPQSVVMDYIGHDSAAVSSGYTHTGRDAMEKAAAAFPEL